MKYDPIKKSLGRCIKSSLFLRKAFYFFLDLLLLRAWHVRRSLRKASHIFNGKANVLDAGSGFGQYTWRMGRMNNEWSIRGVDIDQEHIDDCKEFFRKSGLSHRISFEAADLTGLKDTECYDIILTVDVMEHIREDERVFQNFYRALKPDGIIIISTPSDRGGSDADGEGSTSFIDEHVRNGYGIDEITGKLGKTGFRDTNASYTYGIPGNISWKLSMKYPVKMLNVSRVFFLILPFYYLIFFPVTVLLNITDVCLNHKTGTGLIITARK